MDEAKKELWEKWSKFFPILIGDECMGVKIILALEAKRIIDEYYAKGQGIDKEGEKVNG